MNNPQEKKNCKETTPDIFTWFWIILWAHNQNFGAVRSHSLLGSVFIERNGKGVKATLHP